MAYFLAEFRRVVLADNADTRRSFKGLIFSQSFAELFAQITLILAEFWFAKTIRHREDEGRSDLKHRKFFKKDRAEIASGEKPSQ